jgi:hypothetical protein
MANKIAVLFRQMKDTISQTNLTTLIVALLMAGSVAILSIKTLDLQRTRRTEIQANQFSFSREMAQRLFIAERELAAVLTDAKNDERIYHNDILFDHTTNGAFNESGVNEISRLKVSNSGRFKAVDEVNKEYSSKIFSLQSFPLPTSPLHWVYNPKTASGLLVVPNRSEIVVANVPVAWFANVLRFSKKSSNRSLRGSGPKETFDWAIVYAPGELEKKALKEEQNAIATNAPPAANGQSQTPPSVIPPAEKKTTQRNFLLSSSDSVLFRQTLSSELLSSGILDGPARYLTAKNSFTEQTAMSVIPIEKSNLRLLTKWSTRWSFQDVVLAHSSDFWLLLILAALFLIASIAFKSKFRRLTTDLRNALVELNPSNSTAISSSRPRRLEELFGEIFESAVWLYRIASQRQQKYSALAQIFKALVNNDNVFLVHVDEGVTTSHFHLTVDNQTRWKICLLRSPYEQSGKSEVLFAVAGDAALAKIMMMLASNFYMEQSAKRTTLEAMAEQFFAAISGNSGPINVSCCWMEFANDAFTQKDITLYFQSSSDVLKIEFDEGVATLIDKEDFKAFRFERLDKVANDPVLGQFAASGEQT